MKTPLANPTAWAENLAGQARLVLTPAEFTSFLNIPEPDRQVQIAQLLQKPIAKFSLVNEVFFRSRWAEALRMIAAPQDLTLLEVGTGDTDVIPQMMDVLYPASRYIAANMNKQLTAGLRSSLSSLQLETSIIEEDAAGIKDFLPAASVDVIAFQHAVNDVLQAILCGQRGIDTVHTNWMETLPAMICILQRELEQNTLEEHVRQPWISLLGNLRDTLKPGGWMVMNHYMFQLDLDWGYPAGLWENLIPLIRAWLPDLTGCEEKFFHGFDPQWWMFLRKKP